MLAAITDAVDGDLIGVHRTFLRPDGSGQAPLSPTKMILGGKKGGVIRLVRSEAIEVRIAYAEGIETALSAIRAGWPCWSAIDAGNLAALPVWPGCDLTIFADHDSAGLTAASRLSERWLSAGGQALVATPARVGWDWNDVAQQYRGAA